MTAQNGNAATAILDQLGVSGAEESPGRDIPCGHNDTTNDGRQYQCGAIIRGRTYFCRDCMAEMVENASEITEMAVTALVKVCNELAVTGAVSHDTAIEAMAVVDHLTQET